MSILILVVLVAGLWLFNANARNLINAGVMNTVAWIINHTPTVSKILIVVGAIIFLPILLGVSWIYMWSAIGSWALSPIAGLIIGIGSLIGIFFFRGLMRPLIVIATFAIIFGFCFPVLKGAINQYSQGQQIQLANELDGKTLQMQPQGVADGVVVESGVLYDDRGKPTTTAAKEGSKVRTVSLEKKQFSNSPETFVKIMLQDINNDFFAGSTGWIPTRKLELGFIPTSAKAGEAGGTLIDTVRIDQPGFARKITGSLPPNDYKIKFDNKEAETGAQLMVILPNGETEMRTIVNNSVSVKKGESGFGIKADKVAIAKIFVS